MSKGTRQAKKEIELKLIDEENKKLKNRIEKVQPHFKSNSFIDDFNKHLYYRERMEKFMQIQKKIKLKALQNIGFYEQSIENRYQMHGGKRINSRYYDVNASHQNSFEKLSPRFFSTDTYSIPSQSTKNQNDSMKNNLWEIFKQNDLHKKQPFFDIVPFKKKFKNLHKLHPSDKYQLL